MVLESKTATWPTELNEENKIYDQLNEALKVGDKVKVMKFTKMPGTSGTDPKAKKFLGKTGKIVSIDTDEDGTTGHVLDISDDFMFQAKDLKNV